MFNEPDLVTPPLVPVSVNVYVPGGVVRNVSRMNPRIADVPGRRKIVPDDRGKRIGPDFLRGETV